MFLITISIILLEINKTYCYALQQKISATAELSVREKEGECFPELIYADKLNKLHARVTLTKSIQINPSCPD